MKRKQILLMGPKETRIKLQPKFGDVSKQIKINVTKLRFSEVRLFFNLKILKHSFTRLSQLI